MHKISIELAQNIYKYILKSTTIANLQYSGRRDEPRFATIIKKNGVNSVPTTPAALWQLHYFFRVLNCKNEVFKSLKNKKYK